MRKLIYMKFITIKNVENSLLKKKKSNFKHHPEIIYYFSYRDQFF